MRDEPRTAMAAGWKTGSRSAVSAGGVLFATSDSGPGVPRDGMPVIGEAEVGAVVESGAARLMGPVGGAPVEMRAVDTAEGCAVRASRQAAGGRR